MSGFVLSYDMVFVPDPAFTRLTFGLTGTVPRHVPSDAFVTALASVLSADVVQKLVLLAIFVMACASAAALVPAERTVPRLAAGVCYAWNPFVAERLLLGQWALLLGYAALPWVVSAAACVTEPGGRLRLARALLPAAVGGFAAMTVSGMVAVPVALLGTAARAQRPAARAQRPEGRARPREAAPWRAMRQALWGTMPPLVVLSLPWLITGSQRLSGLPGDSAAVAAFAARADTPFGTLGSLLLLGGAWNRETVPAGYGTPVTVTAWLVVITVALVTYVRRCRVVASPPTWANGLSVAAAAGFAVAALGAVAAAPLEGMITAWPAFAVFRDGQQYVAPLAVVVAVGLGLAVDRIMRTDSAGLVMGLLALLTPPALLPSLAWGAGGRLCAVDYPADWARARAIITADRDPGRVLVLPWAAYRGYRWNHGRRVLDPLPRYLPREVVVNDAVVVGRTVIAAENPRVRELDALIRSDAALTGPLRAAGIRYVIVDDTSWADGGAVRSRLAGAQLLLDGPDVVLFRIR